MVLKQSVVIIYYAEFLVHHQLHQFHCFFSKTITSVFLFFKYLELLLLTSKITTGLANLFPGYHSFSPSKAIPPPLHLQKQSSRGVLSKRCSENMQQVYRKTPMSRCDFNRVPKHYSHSNLAVHFFSLFI